MSRKSASLTLLGICIILSILLLTDSIKPVASGLIFAVSLLTLGGLSRGFRTRLKGLKDEQDGKDK